MDLFTSEDEDLSWEGSPNLSRQAPSAAALAYDWLTWLQDVRHRQPRTLGTYADVLTKWLAWCDAQDVNPMRPAVDDMERFQRRVRPRRRKVGKAATQAIDVKVLRNFYGWANTRHRLPENYAEQLIAPTVKRQDPKPMDESDWQTIWGSDLSPRTRGWLGLTYFGGLRRDELVQLTCAQITPTRIKNFTRKGGGEDTLPWYDMAHAVHESLPSLLPDIDVLVAAVEHTRSHHEKPSPYGHGNQVYTRMERLCRSLGIQRWGPHSMRHSCATNLLAAGIPVHIVSRLMNHGSIEITMGYVRAGANELHEFLALRRGKVG